MTRKKGFTRSFKGYPLQTLKNRLLIHEFFLKVNIIDIDIKVVRLNKYTLEIHLKFFFNLS